MVEKSEDLTDEFKEERREAFDQKNEVLFQVYVLSQLAREVDHQEELFNQLTNSLKGFSYETYQTDTEYYETMEITKD